jgi:hypothetical protein
MGKEGMHTECWWGNLLQNPLGRPRRRWENNIKINLRETYEDGR